jgi:hypothetical protein
MIYRIVEEKNKLNQTKYYIERNVFLTIFWVRLELDIDMNGIRETAYFNTVGEAKDYLEFLKAMKVMKKKRKEIQRTVIYYTEM